MVYILWYLTIGVAIMSTVVVLEVAVYKDEGFLDLLDEGFYGVICLLISVLLHTLSWPYTVCYALVKTIRERRKGS